MAKLAFGRRPLRPKEVSVVERELRAEAVQWRIAGCLFVVFGICLMGLAVMAYAYGSSVPGLFLLAGGALMLICGLTGAMYRSVPIGQTYFAVKLRGVCRSVESGSGKDRQTELSVAGHLVKLRAGWSSFWPEGQEAVVELCLVVSGAGPAQFTPVLVSLPGMTIAKWLRHPPPRLKGVGVLASLSLLGLSAFVCASIVAISLANTPHIAWDWLTVVLVVAAFTTWIGLWGEIRLGRRHDAKMAAWVQKVRSEP